MELKKTRHRCGSTYFRVYTINPCQGDVSIPLVTSAPCERNTVFCSLENKGNVVDFDDIQFIRQSGLFPCIRLKQPIYIIQIIGTVSHSYPHL